MMNGLRLSVRNIPFRVLSPETARLFKIHPATVSRLLALQLQKEKGATNV